MCNIYNSFCKFAVLLIFLMFFSDQASAQDVCLQAASQEDSAVREQYQQTIDFYTKVAAAVQLKGIDPRHFPQLDENQQVVIIDLIQIIESLSNKRDTAISAIYASFQQCRSGFQPYQQILDTGTFFLTGGMSSVIPSAASHIDASQLMQGTPFGGSGALVPQVREQIFQQLGIGGDMANIIRNPLQVSPSGPIRIPWNPIFPGIPIGSGLPQLPPLPQVVVPQIRLPSPPPPIQLGTIGGHRICVPWC